MSDRLLKESDVLKAIDKRVEELSKDPVFIRKIGRMAENCDRFLSKGRKVAIQGHIHTDSYKDQEGRTIYTTDVIADRVEFLGGGQSQQESRPQPQQGYNQGYVPQGQTTPLPEQSAAPGGYTALVDDDIPF